MTAYELALLVCDLRVAGLDPAVWMPRIKPVANACEVFARSVPDNKDYFDRVDGRAPEDCWCYVRLVPPGRKTVCRHRAPGPRDGWTAVLDACCYSHQAAAVDWRGCSRLGFRLTTTTSRPAALEAAAGMLNQIAESAIDEWDDDVSDDDEDLTASGLSASRLLTKYRLVSGVCLASSATPGVFACRARKT